MRYFAFHKVRRSYVLTEHKNAIVTTSCHWLCKDIADVHSGESWSIIILNRIIFIVIVQDEQNVVIAMKYVRN